MTAFNKGKLLGEALIGVLNLVVALCLGHKLGWEIGVTAWWIFMWLYAFWLKA